MGKQKDEIGPSAATKAASSTAELSPAVVRTTLVRILDSAGENGLDPSQLHRKMSEHLESPMLVPIDSDIRSLLTLGIIERHPEDERLFRTTDLATPYLNGADIIAS